MSEQNKSEGSVSQSPDPKSNTTKPESESSTEYKYVVLMETSGEECESWYYCIRYEEYYF